MQRPIRIAVCVPLYAPITPLWFSSFLTLMFSFSTDKNFVFFILTSMGVPVSHGRNKVVRDWMKKAGPDKRPDFALWLDTDNLVTKEQVLRLIEDDCDVVSALYFKKTAPCQPVAAESVPGSNAKMPLAKYGKNSLQEIEYTGMGCCLMKWAVLEKAFEAYEYPFDFEHRKDPENQPAYLSEDYVFCEHARALGFKIFLDARVVSGHIGGVVDESGFENSKGNE